MLTAHPAADLFPLLEGVEFDSLVASVKAHGLRDPITVYEGKILDGRNRWRACDAAGVAPQTVEWKPANGESPWDFVWDRNAERRHLSQGQKAILADERAEASDAWKAEQHKRHAKANEARSEGLRRGAEPATREKVPSTARPRTTGTEHSAALIAKGARVGTRTVEQAHALRRADPVRAAAVKRGEISLDRAVKEVRREQTRAEKIARPFPSGRFAVVYADPPWSYSNSGLEQSAASQYPTMATADVAALPVPDLCGDWTVLFLWATAPLLTDALRVMREWGFEYKTCAVWVKDRAPGMGWWLKTRHELLLIGVRGDVPQPAEKSDSVIEADVAAHSAKPQAAYELIERAYGDVPRVELFARSERAGWTAWGNEPAAAGERADSDLASHEAGRGSVDSRRANAP